MLDVGNPFSSSGDVMVLGEIFERFVEQSPVCVMVRATLENVLSAERVDELFARAAVRQYPSELLFSSVADVMGLVVYRIHPTVSAVYQARAELFQVSLAALYEKLKGVETNVSRTLVRETAARMGAMVRQTGGALAELLPGYRVLIADGNHLPASQRRLKELRTENVAPLPGHATVIFDPELMLAVDVLPCVDGHASERTLLPALLERLEQRDLLIADRNFCTTGFLLGIAARDACFLIRQHGSSLKYELIGRRRKIGRIDTGMVYEQALQLLGGRDHENLVIRRITIKLDAPTRDGHDEIHVLSNLPATVKPCKLATLYRRRWTVETAFQEIEAHLKSEINTLAYPPAALLGFCMALVSYNVLSVVRAALRGVHGEQIDEKVSSYYLADEVAGVSRGMSILLPGDFWHERFGRQTPSQMAQFLLMCGRRVRLSAFRKHPRGANKKPPPTRKQGRVHVATQRIIDARKTTPAPH